MNNKPVYLTAEGLEKLKAELNHLITSERPRVASRIHDAKLDGDLTENAEYEDAKQEQSFLEGRIATLESQLKNAEVIEKANGDKVGIGSKVVIKGGDGEETFTIVGSAEAAPPEGGIGNESPVGAAPRGADHAPVPGRSRPDGAQEGRQGHRPGPGRAGLLHGRPRQLTTPAPMFWADELAARLSGAQVVNDSKTPSGTIHVGSLRGPVIADVI